VLLAFLLLDLSFYYWHRLNHTWPLLWRFHNVHHIDPDLDSTTAFRFHFGEIAYSTVFRVVQIAVIGPGAFAFVLYEGIFLAATVFHHSNVRLPPGTERLLSVFIVTPRMHGIHHSIIREETNSNFSVVLRLWDTLHRTLRLDINQNEIRIGVAAYATDKDNSVAQLLLLPFRKQRKYWQTPDGKSRFTRR
jgi:sterol desaturase/sphingolipid hydroxylase (fatty acid hydroxylase superfamily)